uniref:Uncharacterized protein n=1 Tax=Babesia bovis TaxID=5865 RepID=S6B7S9_BABBO|nr:hypothetical protein [Babesia bovis]
MNATTIPCVCHLTSLRLSQPVNCNPHCSIRHVFIRDEDVDYDTSVTSNESELVQKLKATRNMMLNQIKQMNDTESSMLKSSTYISRQAEILQVLKQRFGTARQLFVSVRRKTIHRYGTVRVCYFVFLGACGFITLRRLRIFKYSYILTRFALTAPFKIVNLLYA